MPNFLAITTDLYERIRREIKELGLDATPNDPQPPATTDAEETSTPDKDERG